MIKTVWFDFGGVLSPPIEHIFDIYYNKTGISPQQLKTAMQHVAHSMDMPMLAPIENATLSEKKWGALLREALKKLYPMLDTSKAELETFGKQWFADIKANEIMLWLFKQLKQQGYQVAILTNNVREWEEYWRAMIGLDNEADYIIDSCKYACRKPDEAFFKIAEKAANSTESANLLIDDVIQNCTAAQSIGWNAIAFVSNTQVLKDIQAHIDVEFPNISSIPHYDFEPTYRVIEPQTDNSPEIIEILSKHKAYHITSYEDVKAVLSSNDCIRKPTNQIGGASILPTLTPDELLLNLDDSAHARMKKFAMMAYKPSYLHAFEETMRHIIQHYVHKAKTLEHFDLLILLDNIIIHINAQFLGINLDMYQHVLKPLTKTVQIADKDNTHELVKQFMQLYHYILEFIQEKHECNDGLISMWLLERNNITPALTDKELCGLGSVLGGYQNTLTGISKIIYALLYFPILWNLIRDDVSLIPNMINELFRLTNLGNASAFPRIAAKEIKLSRYRIPQDSVLYPDAFLANRDASVFTNPLQINPFREYKPHLQFGAGAHHCMGRSWIELIAKLILQELILSLPFIMLDNALHLEWDNGIILRRPKSIPILNLF